MFVGPPENVKVSNHNILTMAAECCAGCTTSSSLICCEQRNKKSHASVSQITFQAAWCVCLSGHNSRFCSKIPIHRDIPTPDIPGRGSSVFQYGLRIGITQQMPMHCSIPGIFMFNGGFHICAIENLAKTANLEVKYEKLRWQLHDFSSQIVEPQTGCKYGSA